MKKKSMLIVAIILMSIGFAAVSTTLIINGNAKVSENQDDFSVIFTAATLDGKDVYSTVVDDTKKIINFTTSDLKTLNQTSILNYEVTNNSSNYDAEVKVTCVPKEGTTAKYTSIKNELENNATKVLAKESINGTLTITLNKTAIEEVSEKYTCKLEFNAVERGSIGEKISEPLSFATDSWATIQNAVQMGNTSKYNVGDTKEVDLGNFGTRIVRISNMSACSTETSETACGFVVEFADIITKQLFNSTETNVGGWKDSEMRTYINETIYNALPSDLQSVVTSTKVISGHGSTAGETNFETQDKLYLLSVKEVYGEAEYDTVDTETKQLDFYKNNGTTTSNYGAAGKRRAVNGTNNLWWLRTPNRSNAGSFIRVGSSGHLTTGSDYTSLGVSPAFRIA